MKLGNFNGIEARIAEWEKKYPLAEFTNPEIIRKIKEILNKEFLTRLISDSIAAKILHIEEKKQKALDDLQMIKTRAYKTKNFKRAIIELNEWKENLVLNGLSLEDFNRSQKSKIFASLFFAYKELKNQEEAMQKLKELKEKGSSLDSDTFTKELTSWQDKYCVKMKNFPEKLQTEINTMTTELLKSINNKKTEEAALEQLQTVLTSPPSDINPLDSIALILAQYDYTNFSEETKKQIDAITQTLSENFKLDFDFREEDSNAISRNLTSAIQFKALSDLKDIISKNPYDLDGILNWLYVNRYIAFTEYTGNEILKLFASVGYKIPHQSSYSIPEINTNLTYKDFSQINDDFKKNVILNFLGNIAQGNNLSTTSTNNLEQIHYTSEQKNLVIETAVSDSSIVFITEPPPTSEDTIFDEKGTIAEPHKDSIVLAIEDILNDSATTYEIPISTKANTTNLSNEDNLIYETQNSPEALEGNSIEQKPASFEIPVYDTTTIITTTSEKESEIKTTSSTLDNSQTIYSSALKEKEDSSLQTSTIETSNNLEENVSLCSSTSQLQEVSPLQNLDETTSTTVSVTEEPTSSSSYTLALEDQDEPNTTTLGTGYPISISSYTLPFDDQERLEKIYHESSYITIAYPIIFEALSHTSKTPTTPPKQIGPEKNNDL